MPPHYLANLCDETRFQGWPVVEHIPLLQVGSGSVPGGAGNMVQGTGLRLGALIVLARLVIFRSCWVLAGHSMP